MIGNNEAMMSADTVTKVRHRCNACGKFYFDHTQGSPEHTSLVVTDCADCAPPSGPRLTKFFDAQGGRLLRPREYLPPQLDETRYTLRHMADRVPAPEPTTSLGETVST